MLWRCWLSSRKGIRPVKNWVVGYWHGYLSGARCRCILPSWCHCHSLSLASVKSRLVLPFWYRLTRVVPEKGPLNGCVFNGSIQSTYMAALCDTYGTAHSTRYLTHVHDARHTHHLQHSIVVCWPHELVVRLLAPWIRPGPPAAHEPQQHPPTPVHKCNSEVSTCNITHSNVNDAKNENLCSQAKVKADYRKPMGFCNGLNHHSMSGLGQTDYDDLNHYKNIQNHYKNITRSLSHCQKMTRQISCSNRPHVSNGNSRIPEVAMASTEHSPIMGVWW